MSNKLTLQRKIRSTLNVFSSGGKSKKVQVEVRKRHTYVCHDSKVQNVRRDNTVDSLLSNNSSEENLLIRKLNAQGDLKVYGKKSQELSSHKRNLVPSSPNILTGSQRFLKNFTDSQYKSSVNNNKYQIKNLFHSSHSHRETSHILEHRRNNDDVFDVSCVSCKTESNLEENIIRKKISHDRRFRTRQRLRSFKLRNFDKINIGKYRGNAHDYFLDMKYECDDETQPVLHEIKSNNQRKVSVLTHAFNKPTRSINRDIVVGKSIIVSELANRMAVKSSYLIKIMMRMGIMVTINQVIDQKTACLVAEKMGHRVILRSEDDLESMIIHDRNLSNQANNISAAFLIRPPVVVVMGHVDHGKTSILDCIRSTRVVASEIGGITQRMGAYCVEFHGKKITFLDTPGHSAFSAMRMRGVKITDLVVLVVAVDDGVMLQTIEAIQNIQSVKIPMIVALNKIDKVECSSDLDRIKNDLAQYGIISEEWGGETQFVSVSAKLKVGIDDLLNAILLESELLDLKVIYNGMASGIVIESYLDKGRGPVAIVLIQEGMLKCGDVILCGLEYGRVRSMRNEIGDHIDSACPSMPVEVFGLSGPPFAGDLMVVVPEERKAREVALYRQRKFRSEQLARKKQIKLERVLNNISNSEENINCLMCNFVLKVDVQGSLEAIRGVLDNLSKYVKVNIVGSGVGAINETDVYLAISTQSILLGFNVRSDILARRIIESENLSVYYHSVIYNLIDDVKRIMDSMLVPKYKRKNIAVAEVRDVFSFPKLGSIAGCVILEGVVRRHNKVRILRNDVVIHEGELESLRRFKDDVSEVRAGMECGIAIKNYKDIHLGDFIEVFENIDITVSTVN